MRFVEVVLNEPGKNVVALADSHFFPPYQPMLFRFKASKPAATISSLQQQQQQQLPPRQARLVVYNKKTNKTSIWLVELSNQVLNAPSAAHHHHAKILSSVVVPDVQPPMVRKLQLQNVFLYSSCLPLKYMQVSQRQKTNRKKMLVLISSSYHTTMCCCWRRHDDDSNLCSWHTWVSQLQILFVNESCTGCR
jgi:hypothetical protein